MISTMSAEQYVADHQRERRAAAEAYRIARLALAARKVEPERSGEPSGRHRRSMRAAAWAS